MYTVWTYDDAVCDEVMVFEGSYAECAEFISEDPDGDYLTIEPDGFTVCE